ncbi:uncharacterized protein LOC111340248, partial [Stylophora pistillata]|uniref:uncharacterized protein LOC111340248 n=1 Tax=Stylophora pistillata TaxID=50429 RepID=UPI000C0573D9
QVCLEKKKYHGRGKKGWSDLEFYRDSTTGLRKYKHKYRPSEEDDLEAALVKCEEVLPTFQIASSKTWETRMSNLTSSWDNIRKWLIEAVLSCEGFPSPDIYSICLEGKVCIRFMECLKQFMCHSCGEKVHKSLPLHDRDTYVNGYFHAIPPTVGVDGKGYHQIIGNLTIYSVHFFKLLFSLHMLNYTF